MGKNHFVGSLIQNSRDAQHQDRHAIVQHRAKHLAIKGVTETRKFFVEKEGDERRTCQVDAKHITHLEGIIKPMGEHYKVRQVCYYVQHNKEQLQRSKLHRLLLQTQIAKGYALKGINRHTGCHHPNVLWVGSVTHKTCDGIEENCNDCYE